MSMWGVLKRLQALFHNRRYDQQQRARFRPACLKTFTVPVPTSQKLHPVRSRYGRRRSMVRIVDR